MYVQYLQYLQEVLDLQQMHYVVDLHTLEESLEFLIRRHRKQSPAQ